MGQFFHSTRRKMGVTTLILASIFMAGWTRSLADEDYFQLPFKIYSIIGVGSERQSLVLFANNDSPDRWSPNAAFETGLVDQGRAELISPQPAPGDSDNL